MGAAPSRVSVDTREARTGCREGGGPSPSPVLLPQLAQPSPKHEVSFCPTASRAGGLPSPNLHRTQPWAPTPAGSWGPQGTGTSPGVGMGGQVPSSIPSQHHDARGPKLWAQARCFSLPSPLQTQRGVRTFLRLWDWGLGATPLLLGRGTWQPLSQPGPGEGTRLVPWAPRPGQHRPLWGPLLGAGRNREAAALNRTRHLLNRAQHQIEPNTKSILRSSLGRAPSGSRSPGGGRAPSRGAEPPFDHFNCVLPTGTSSPAPFHARHTRYSSPKS